MRIISGLARGIKLDAPEGLNVRPTEDRVKESIFSTLGTIDGKSVLDLFSGTGALGMEALSRGAASVTSVEINPAHCEVIRANAQKVFKAMKLQTENSSFKLITQDANLALETLTTISATFDIILADPPYETANKQYGWLELIKDPRLVKLASQNAIFMLEHSSNAILPADADLPWTILRDKTFGIRAACFMTTKNNSHHV